MITDENKLAKEIEEAMTLPNLPKASVLPVTKAEHKAELIRHSQRIDELINELQMTIRILEEAKRRL